MSNIEHLHNDIGHMHELRIDLRSRIVRLEQSNRDERAAIRIGLCLLRKKRKREGEKRQRDLQDAREILETEKNKIEVLRGMNGVYEKFAQSLARNIHSFTDNRDQHPIAAHSTQPSPSFFRMGNKRVHEIKAKANAAIEAEVDDKNENTKENTN
nr:hypothetical protein Iba_chr12cCG22630 [Ipomoea batatas]